MKRRFFFKHATVGVAATMLPFSNGWASSMEEDFFDGFSKPFRLKEKFQSLELLFDGNLDWVIELYDPQTGGFCESVGMARDPQFPAHIQATCQVVAELMNFSGLMATMPTSVKERIVNFLNENQDPATGLYCDKAYPKIKESKRADRHIARLTGFALRTLDKLDAKPRYKIAADESGDASAPYLKTVQTWEAWVKKTVNGDRPFYGSLDDVGSHTTLILGMPRQQQKEYLDAAINYINPFQDVNTGLWDNSMDATFKYVGFLHGVSRPIPNAEKIVASIYAWYEKNEDNLMDNTCFVCNPVRMLPELEAYTPKKYKTDQQLSVLIDWHIAHFKPFLQADGGFSRWQHKFNKDVLDTFYGKWDTPMADVNGNAQTIVARKALYEVAGIKAPPLPHAEGFWDRFEERHYG